MPTTSPAVRTNGQPGKLFNGALWLVQLLLAAAYAMAGVMKSTMPIAELAPKLPWTADVPVALVRFIGVSELAGAVGLVLPALTRIKPGLTPLAGAGLVVVMALASVFHITRGEFAGLAFTMTLGALAAFAAWGRTARAPIAPR
jgi:putative oxidoreductase